MQETREVACAAGPDIPPTAPDRRPKKITTRLMALGVLGAAALGLLHDGGSDPTVPPSRLTPSPVMLSPDAKGASIVPFPDTSASMDGVSGVDG